MTTDNAELAAIRARDAVVVAPTWHSAQDDCRTLLRMLDEARTTLFHAQQAVLKEGLARDALVVELADANSDRDTLSASCDQWIFWHKEDRARMATLEAALCTIGGLALAGRTQDDFAEIFRKVKKLFPTPPAPAQAETEHCKDCCCARSWRALGIDTYTGKSIPEHITALREALLTSPCPRPCDDAEDSTVSACIAAGCCGCDNEAALGSPGEQP